MFSSSVVRYTTLSLFFFFVFFVSARRFHTFEEENVLGIRQEEFTGFYFVLDLSFFILSKKKPKKKERRV